MTDVKKYLAEMMDKRGLGHLFGTWKTDWIMSDVRIFAAVFEAGHGAPAVVFVPGTSIYALCYAELMHGMMERGINVVGIDPRGQGQSGGNRGDYTIMEHVADIRAAVDYARKRFSGKVFVMGSSQGGIEAFYLAAAGDQLDGVVCHNLADLPSPQSLRLTRFGPARKLGPVAAAGGKAMVAVLKAAAQASPGLRIPVSLYLDLAKEKMRPYGDAAAFIKQDPMALEFITLRAFASIAATELPTPIEEIRTPLLLLHSTGDNIFPEDYVRDIFDKLTGDKEIQIYKDLPHLITIENVPRILPDVVGWIKAKS